MSNIINIPLPEDYRPPAEYTLISPEQWALIINHNTVMLSSRNKQSNNEKGTTGEQSIISILKTDMFIDAVIEDVSGIAAMGDILFKWRNIKCLIEVKNKQSLTKNDMDKFIRDIQQSTVINCAIFISLKTNEFPNRSRIPIQVDMHGNIPIVYCHLLHDSNLLYAVYYLSHLLNNQLDQNTTLLADYFNKYYADLQLMQQNTLSSIKQKEREILSLKRSLSSYTQQLEHIKMHIPQLINHLPNKIIESPDDFLERLYKKCINRLLEYKKNLDRYPTYNEIIKESIISRSEYKQLTTIYKKSTLQHFYSYINSREM